MKKLSKQQIFALAVTVICFITATTLLITLNKDKVDETTTATTTQESTTAVEVTTTAVEESTTEKSTTEEVEDETDEPEATEKETTTKKPVVTTTKKQVVTTTKKPVVTTTKKQVVTTTKAPVTTTKKPVVTTTKKPVTTTKAPVTTTKKTVVTTTKAPVTTTKKQESSVSDRVLQARKNGCSICGSKSCKSLYAEKWGVATIDVKLCPKYGTTLTCKTCGRPKGNGTNGTCNICVMDSTCPNCGKAVKAMHCHTCK